jgi:PAS domain S-box-containing protein
VTAEPPAPAAISEHPSAGTLQLIVGGVVDYAIFGLDPQGHVTSWNEGARRLKQYDEHEILGRHFSTFYPPEDVAAGLPDRLLGEAAHAGRVETEGWRIRKDGSRFWADVVITALRSPDGSLRGFTKVTRDLTERRAVEEALRQSEERLRVMVESVVDYAIFMLDDHGRVMTWNEGARLLKQYEPGEIIGCHFSAFYPPEDQVSGKPQRLLDEAVRSGRVEDEGWRVRKDGSRFWADVIITALRSDDGRLLGFVKVTRDLTERRNAEEALRDIAKRESRAAEQLRAAARSRQNLIAIVAHDLRAPVGVLHGSAETLVRDWDRIDDMERLQLVQTVLSSSSRLSALVDDVLDLTRIEAGTLRYDLMAVDLVDTVVRAAADVDPAGRRIAVLPKAGSVLVRGDERRIWQIATNLLSNALKFSGPEQPVEVVIDTAGRSGRVSVTDHGIGMTQQEQKRLFHPFSRIRDEAGLGRGAGMGLGLYIARSLVTDQGGDIEVRSELGAGSTFDFTLPLAL